MSELPIGLVLRQIFDEKTISATHLVKELGISKQAVYNNFKRTNMNNADINKWAEILGVTSEEILSRRRGEKTESSTVEQKGESKYLMDHLANLEEQFKRLLQQLEIKDKQLEVKDQQMAGLQKTVEILLGKSKGVMKLMATPIVELGAYFDALRA
jgi:arsenate reductase-like glutaredoxin family protein